MPLSAPGGISSWHLCRSASPTSSASPESSTNVDVDKVARFPLPPPPLRGLSQCPQDWPDHLSTLRPKAILLCPVRYRERRPQRCALGIYFRPEEQQRCWPITPQPTRQIASDSDMVLYPFVIGPKFPSATPEGCSALRQRPDKPTWSSHCERGILSAWAIVSRVRYVTNS